MGELKGSPFLCPLVDCSVCNAPVCKCNQYLVFADGVDPFDEAGEKGLVKGFYGFMGYYEPVCILCIKQVPVKQITTMLQIIKLIRSLSFNFIKLCELRAYLIDGASADRK